MASLLLSGAENVYSTTTARVSADHPGQEHTNDDMRSVSISTKAAVTETRTSTSTTPAKKCPPRRPDKIPPSSSLSSPFVSTLAKLLKSISTLSKPEQRLSQYDALHSHIAQRKSQWTEQDSGVLGEHCLSLVPCLVADAEGTHDDLIFLSLQLLAYILHIPQVHVCMPNALIDTVINMLLRLLTKSIDYRHCNLALWIISENTLGGAR